MTLEEAIKTAIEHEKKVQQLYVQATRDAKDAIGKKVFKLLAGEEYQHVLFLEAQLAKWQSEGKVDQDALDTVVPNAEAIGKQLEKLQTSVVENGQEDELILLQKARQVEQETSGFYQRMTRELDATGRDFFQQFVQSELGHLALVDAEINAITGAGFWFDMQEFNLENS